ncbi:MAG: hypothetical protein R2766_07380 [Saprospiraceae bacterium]
MKSHLILTLVFLSIQFCMAQKSARLDSLYSSIEYDEAIELGRNARPTSDPTVNHILGRALAVTKNIQRRNHICYNLQILSLGMDASLVLCIFRDM